MTTPNSQNTKLRGMECDYCGEQGHAWSVHPEARDDVAAWERAMARESNR